MRGAQLPSADAPSLVTVNVSLTSDELDDLDTLIERCEALGGKSPSRSRIARLAIRELLERATREPDELAAALDRMPAARR